MATSKPQVLAISGKGVFGKVANYSALPAANLHEGETWICLASQGTSWLPGSLLGTFYDKGQYYSDGTDWVYDSTPYQASQSAVNAGLIDDQFVSPNTLANSSWAFTTSKVLATILSGLNVAIGGTITSADTILQAFGKLQYQISNLVVQSITDGDTTHAPSGDVVFDALALKLTASNNLSDVSNPITARNNLKEWNLYLTGGDQSTTSNVASNITDLVTPTLDANKVYAFDIFMRVGCSASGGVKFQLTTPTGSSFVAVIDGVTATNSSRNAQIISASATLTSLAFITVAGVSFVRINGTLSNGVNVGTLQVGFASATNTQTSTIYSLGTYMFVKQLN